MPVERVTLAEMRARYPDIEKPCPTQRWTIGEWDGVGLAPLVTRCGCLVTCVGYLR